MQPSLASRVTDDVMLSDDNKVRWSFDANSTVAAAAAKPSHSVHMKITYNLIYFDYTSFYVLFVLGRMRTVAITYFTWDIWPTVG